MSKGIKGGWCISRDKEFAREVDELHKLSSRIDAWKLFLNSSTIRKLHKLKGHAIWFNRYEFFERMICEFDCSEKALREAICSMLRPKKRLDVRFHRNDIYDARAWCRLPLSCFIEVKGSEVPVIDFGVKLPWVVTRDCFTLTHRLKRWFRFAEMTFNHPQLNPRFEGRRWVADSRFPKEATRQEMTEALMADVKAKCAGHMVTIVDSIQSNKR
jgi:hypothetical protein